MSKGRILSGMRPTGQLHVGHLIGVLNNWAKLQDEYQCFFMVADIHALTTDYENPGDLEKSSIEVVKDWLSCGIDPAKSVLFRQSDVPEHAQLHLYLSMLTPLGWLYRCPSYKEQLKELKERDLNTHGFLGYPLLQAADILVYKATAVPVGEDQLPHIELTREIARRFNSLYTKEKPVFPEPKGLVTPVPKVPGCDGRKMSKSYNNAVFLSDEKETLQKKIKTMFTDPEKIKIDDKGHPDGCVVFAFHKIFNPQYRQRETECKEGKTGCVACKNGLVDFFEENLRPLREKRKRIENEYVKKILTDGAASAASVASKTLTQVKKLIGIYG